MLKKLFVICGSAAWGAYREKQLYGVQEVNEMTCYRSTNNRMILVGPGAQSRTPSVATVSNDEEFNVAFGFCKKVVGTLKAEMRKP